MKMYDFGFEAVRIISGRGHWFIRLIDGRIVFYDGKHGMRLPLHRLPYGRGRQGASRS